MRRSAMLAIALALASTPHQASACLQQRAAVTVPLPDFASAGQIVTPPTGVAVRGLLILYPGSDVADMDGSLVNANGAIVSRPMLQLADRLACAGFASLRFNKRFVTGPTTVDRAKFDALNGVDFAADGRTALTFARRRPGFSHLPVGVVGWSEGTTVAMAVASGEAAVRAIVLLAPVVEPPARVAQAQYGRIGKPYLLRYATNDALDADAIARADAGPGGELAHIFVRMFRGFRPGEKINPLLDTNKDGRISFAEADPILASWYADDADSGLGMSTTARALKGVAQAFLPTTPPLLILQGLNDSMIDPRAAVEFAARPDARQRVKILTYPGLGHSLGPARSAQEDSLPPIAAKPLNEMTTWLRSALRG